LGSLKKFQVDPTMLSHQNMPCARLIKQAAGLLRTRFIPHDTRWQATRRGLQRVGLDRFLYLYLLYDFVFLSSVVSLLRLTAFHFRLPLSFSLSHSLTLILSLSFSLSLKVTSSYAEQRCQMADLSTRFRKFWRIGKLSCRQKNYGGFPISGGFLADLTNSAQIFFCLADRVELWRFGSLHYQQVGASAPLAVIECQTASFVIGQG
jgi:hypothetical protein